MTLEEKIKLQIEMEQEQILPRAKQRQNWKMQKKMKEMGFDIEIISSITGLPIEEIKIYRPYDEKTACRRSFSIRHLY